MARRSGTINFRVLFLDRLGWTEDERERYMRLDLPDVLVLERRYVKTDIVDVVTLEVKKAWAWIYDGIR